MSTIAIREVQPNELAEIASFAKFAPRHAENHALALVAVADGQIAGYLEMSPTFFYREFVSLLSVHPAHRRQGVATALMKAAEARCHAGQVFTSTNLSNQPMQALLARMAYRVCGFVEDLDEGDPELIFVKRLNRT